MSSVSMRWAQGNVDPAEAIFPPRGEGDREKGLRAGGQGEGMETGMPTLRTMGVAICLAALGSVVLMACVGSADLAELLGRAASPTAASATVVSRLTSTSTVSEMRPTAAPSVGKATVAGPEVSSLESYRDPDGGWRAVGMVENHSDTGVEALEIGITVLQADGTVLERKIAHSPIFTLAPGEGSPFSLRLSEDLPEDLVLKAEIVDYLRVSVDRAHPLIQDVNLVARDGRPVFVTGRVVNKEGRPILVNSLAAAVLDSDGRVLGVESASVSMAYLPSGGDGAFRVTLFDVDGTSIAGHRVFIDAAFTDPAESHEIALSAPRLFWDALGDVHLVGELTNDSSDPLDVDLVATVCGAGGVVLDVASLDTLPVIPPGERVPFDFTSWGPLSAVGGRLGSPPLDLRVQWDPAWTWTVDSEVARLRTIDDEFVIEGPKVTFSGAIDNDTGRVIEGVNVIVSLRDRVSAEIVAVGSAEIMRSLAVGGRVAYEVTVFLEDAIDGTRLEGSVLAFGE